MLSDPTASLVNAKRANIQLLRDDSGGASANDNATSVCIFDWLRSIDETLVVCEEIFTAAGFKTPMDVQAAMRNVTDKKQVDMELRNMGIKQMRFRKGPLLPTMQNAIYPWMF
jgi:hypothetical protein